MFWKLCIKPLQFYWFRFLLIEIALTISTAYFLFLMSFGEGVRHFLKTTLEAFDFHILITPPLQQFSFEPTIPLEVADTLRKMQIGAVYALFRMPYFGGFPPKALGFVIGKDFRSKVPFIAKYRLIKGKELTDSTQREALIGEALAKVLKKSVGDTISIGTGFYKIVGMIASGVSLTDNAIIAPLRLVMKDMGVFRLYAVAVMPKNPKRTAAIIQRLKKIFPHYAVQTPRHLVEALQSFVALQDLIRLLLASVAWIVATLFVFAVMALTAQQRYWEFALLRALGASQSLLWNNLLVQLLLLAAIAWIMGNCLGIAAIQGVNHWLQNHYGMQLLAFHWRLSLWAALLTLLMACLGGMLPFLLWLKKTIKAVLEQ